MKRASGQWLESAEMDLGKIGCEQIKLIADAGH